MQCSGGRESCFPSGRCERGREEGKASFKGFPIGLLPVCYPFLVACYSLPPVQAHLLIAWKHHKPRSFPQPPQNLQHGYHVLGTTQIQTLAWPLLLPKTRFSPDRGHKNKRRECVTIRVMQLGGGLMWTRGHHEQSQAAFQKARPDKERAHT